MICSILSFWFCVSEGDSLFNVIFSAFSVVFLGISYTLSRSGRPAIFTRDPDANALEFTQIDD
jgi:hypothetical protein